MALYTRVNEQGQQEWREFPTRADPRTGKHPRVYHAVVLEFDAASVEEYHRTNGRPLDPVSPLKVREHLQEWRLVTNDAGEQSNGG